MPFGKKGLNIFYGWWVVAACFVIAMYTAGVIGYGFTAVVEPIVNEFGWSYTQVSFASSLRGVEVGLMAPLVGILVDRFGPRRVMFTGSIIIGIGLVLLGRINSLIMYYASFALIAVGLSTCSNTAMVAAVAYWFKKNMGMAVGIMICGYGFSGFMVPVVVALVDSLGWRVAMLILGLGVFVLILPMTLLIKRYAGSSEAIAEDNAKKTAAGNDLPKAKSAQAGMSVKQVIKSRTFWHVSGGLAFQFLIVSAIITHLMSYCTSIGLSRAVGSIIATAVPLTSIAGRLGFGWLSTRMKTTYLTAIGFVCVSLGMLSFAGAATGQYWLLVPFLLFFGIGYGGINTMRAILPREYFGFNKFGTILGFVMGVNMLGNITGAPLAGFVFDTWGTYQPIWLAFSVIALVGMVIILTTPTLKIDDNK